MVRKITCGKKGREKDFPVLRDSRSRYVERNDNNDDIHAKFHILVHRLETPQEYSYAVIP